MVIVGLMNYDDAFGHMPPPARMANGTALCSWRFAIWHFLERHGFYDRLAWKERWDSPANQAFWKGENFPVYCYPNEGDITFVLAVTGPGTAFGDGRAPPKTFSELDADTIVLIESRNSRLLWPQPGDADIQTLGLYYRSGNAKGPSSIHPGGFHVAFADGEVWFLGNDTPFDVLGRFLTVDGAYQHDRDIDLAQYRR